jgi:hypothetical protein
MQRAGRAPVNLSVPSDTQGSFQLELTPEPTDVGMTTVSAAVAGASCSAVATFTVTLAAAPAASPRAVLSSGAIGVRHDRWRGAGRKGVPKLLAYETYGPPCHIYQQEQATRVSASTSILAHQVRSISGSGVPA